MAGDMRETNDWRRQVRGLLNDLEYNGIPYVMVSSLSQWPEVCLPQHVLNKLHPLTLSGDPRSQQTFIKQCLERAAKVLLLISPGFLQYADEYSDGAKEATVYQQKLIRKLEEKLKEEFFDKRKKFRIWPVLLLALNASKSDIPSFLSDSMFYCFPSSCSGDNIVRLLLEDEDNIQRAAKVKRNI